MKYFKSFLLTLLAFIGTGAWAQTVVNIGASTGTFYRGGTATSVTADNQYVNKWVSTRTPALTFSCSANNMIINSGYSTNTKLNLHKDPSNYTLSFPDGNILSYSITAYATNNTTSSINGTVVSSDANNPTTVKVDVNASTATIVIDGTSSPWMYITDFTVTVQDPTNEQIAAAEKVAGWLALLQSQALVTDVSNYVSNARQQNWEGDYASLLDKDNSTYFHSAWGGTMSGQPNHDLQARLPEAVEKFHIFYVTRSNGTGYPTGFRIDGSNNAEDFSEAGGSGWTENVASVTENLPAGATKSYLSGVITMKNPYQYLRFVPSIGNNKGENWFCLAEFWLFPSNDAIDEAIALMKDLPAAAFLTESQIREINRIDTELRSTTVDVTYELYKSDGTLIGSETVSQQKNSAVNVPASLKTKEYYYDYATEGTIGNTACVIKVTRTLKDNTIVESLADLSNEKVYLITTNENKRKSLSTYTTDGRTYLASEAKEELKLAPKKFAIINYEDNFYLYSVDDQKFVLSGSGSTISLADMVKGTTDRVTFTQTAEPLWMPKFNDENSKIINTSPTHTYAIVVDSWGSSTSQWDDGCQYTLHEAGDFDPQPVLDALQDFFHPDPLAENLALATDVLNNVPYALFPRNFNWDKSTETIKDKNGKDVEVPVKGMSGADYNRTFKIYKNTAGKYQLASRLYVAILARLVEYVDADELAQKEISEYFEKLYEEKGQPWPGIENIFADALKYYARMVVESHGVGAALYEQRDPNYSPMFNLVTNPRFVVASLVHRGATAQELLEEEWATLSDIYEMLHQFISSDYYSSRNYFGFNPNFLAHLQNPNLENNANFWTFNGFKPDGGQSLSDAESFLAGTNQGNRYDYLTLKGAGSGEASQTIQLPAGRYMLTVAGRASRANMVDKTYDGITGRSFEGPFTEASAASPSRYFQIFAKTAQGTRAQSIVPQEGFGEMVGVYGYGWNDASLFFTMPSVGEVTLGVRAQTDVAGAEASFTRFRLTRLGDATLFFDEYQTYETELNWDPVSFFFATAPTDVVLHKQLTPGKWQSIAVPVDLSAEQLLAHFGEGTKLAVPTTVAPLADDEKELVVNFTSWDIAASKEGLVQTKIYGEDMRSEESFYDYPAGMIANVPYLINPAKVNANNMYVFHEVTSSETHGLRAQDEDDYWSQTTAPGIWSWGGFTFVGTDEDGVGIMSAQIENPEGTVVEFKPNYKYTKDFPENYTIEFNQAQKAFTAEFVCSDGYKVVSAMIDGGFEIVTDQLNDMLALGQSQNGQYPGIPTAMENAMTFDPQVKGETGTDGFVLTYTDGEIAEDGKSWTTKDGKITITADDETAKIGGGKYFYNHFQHLQLASFELFFSPGKYTIKANHEGESIYGYRFADLMVDFGTEFTFTKSDGEEVTLETDGFSPYVETPEEVAETEKAESALSFSFSSDDKAALFITQDFAFDLLYNKEFTAYNAEEFAMILDAAKKVRDGIAEAKKAYPLSKEFHAAYAEGEELLATEHTEVEAGADAAFKEVLVACLAAFNRTTEADEIPALTEKLREEIEKFKTQIDLGLKDLEAGMHLFYNIGSNKYLGGSNSWGTQASLTTHGELMAVSKLEDGKYTIETRFTNGNNFHGFAKDHNGIYFMDAAATGAPLEIVCVEPGIYTISDAAGYLGYNGKNTVLGTGLTDADEENILWVIISEEDLLKGMAEDVSLDDPIDATFLIKNPDFSRGHRDVAAWTFTWDGGNSRLNESSASAPADMYNYSAEAWQATFDLSQELEVPNGVYVMEAQGAVTDYSGAYDGTDYPVFFANDETSPFLSMEEQHRGKSMLDLQKAFFEGKYFVAPMVVEVTDGKLTVGAKGTRTDLWATWDNFSLTFYGNANIDDVKQLYGKTTGNEPTGINTVDNGQLAADGWYSIDGRKLNGKPTKKGVYVVNGKKVIVK